MKKIVILWLRRDLRFVDNKAFEAAKEKGLPIQALFIFDRDILDPLEPNDSRVSFIHQRLNELHQLLQNEGSSILVKHGKVQDVWQQLIEEYSIEAVYANEDYEPGTRDRDQKISNFLNDRGIAFHRLQDHLIFHPEDILKDDLTPYKVYTPYKKKWKRNYIHNEESTTSFQPFRWNQLMLPFPALEEIGFTPSSIKVKPVQFDHLDMYSEKRDFPDREATSFLGPHLRFGTVSLRQIVEQHKQNEVFLNELIWREFFMQILYHYPHCETNNFKSQYDRVEWRNKEEEFELWKEGKTGYPMVDAGMRELRETGYMHNRVRMITASFLCKHLLIQWQWGERYFASRLLDFELASNVGNWQWSAGTGCDAVPYFRVFNPTQQLKQYDKELRYVRKWIPEYGTRSYPKPMVDHKTARLRALDTYKAGMSVAG